MKLIFKTPCLIVLLSLGIAAHAVALDFAIVHVVSGCAKQASGDMDGALAEFNRAIEIDPNDAKAYYYRGRVKQAKGDQEGTLADYNRAIELAPKNVLICNNRGLAKAARGDLAAAAADFNHTIELDPKNAQGYNNLAWLLATASDSSLRNGAKAVEYATKACELTQWKNAGIIDTLAAASAENGDFDQAVKWKNKYIESAPANKTAATTRLALYQKHQPYHEAPK